MNNLIETLEYVGSILDIMYFLLVRMVISSFHLCNAYIILHAVGVSPGQC